MEFFYFLNISLYLRNNIKTTNIGPSPNRSPAAPAFCKECLYKISRLQLLRKQSATFSMEAFRKQCGRNSVVSSFEFELSSQSAYL